MEELLRFVCGKLEEHGIDYMLSGSVALNAYSIPRYTRDIDIVIELRAETSRFLLKYLLAGNVIFTVKAHRKRLFDKVCSILLTGSRG